MSLPPALQDDDGPDTGPGARPDAVEPALAPGAAASTRVAFAAATFLGAFLLFLVQPLVGKYVLPWFGGGPAVWTTCMLFFQMALLAGYAYAHLAVSRMSSRAQAVVHPALLAAAVVVALLLNGAHRWQPPAPGAGASELAPIVQILSVLSLGLFLPALALSATSPLLNAWYARAVPGSGARVYRLYAVSNAGSLLALVAYPFLIEPAMSRRAQAAVWWAGLAVFAVLCTVCARLAARAAAGGGAAGAGDDQNDPARATGLATRGMWLALPACASVMLLATTNTLTHAVAAMPLLWVLPLVLYLLTFIVAFDAPRWYRRGVVGAALVLAAAAVCVVLIGADAWLSITVRVALLSAAMFVCCMACHGELAALKPAPRELTGYYLAIAAGGAIGGVLVAVAAPIVLDRYAELHLGLWTSCALALAAPWVTRKERAEKRSGILAMFGVAGLVVLAAVLWEARDPYPYAGGKPIKRWRDFYGVVTLYEAHRGDPQRESVLMRHAGVTHGLQFRSPEKFRRPTTYFGPSSGIGIALRAEDTPAPRRVGVVGLGAGTLAAYGRPGDTFRFYELSPTVARVARSHFTYLADSPARCDVVLGDGRLSLEREPPRGFDVLVLDAFSGHAVPYHLLTQQAFTLYRRHLAPNGVVAVNVTNRYVDLQPVLAQQAALAGWDALLVSNPDAPEPDAVHAADWILLTADPARLADFRRLGGVAPRVDKSLRIWTDDYASLFPVLR